MNKAVLGMRRYVVQISGAMALFIAIVLARRLLVPLHPDWKPALLLAPIAPVLLVAAAIWRMAMNADEYHRRNIVNAVAFGAFLTGVTACIYPFLRNAGLIPVVPYFMAWPVMALGWILVAFRQMWRDSSSEIGAGGTVLRFLQFFGIMAATALAYAVAAFVAGWPLGWAPLLAAAGFGTPIASLYHVFIRKSCG
jgi:hypothetical protein